MSSVLNLSGLNFQGGNPVRRELQQLRSELNELKKQIASGAASSPATVVAGPPGPAGPAGPAGPGGPTGPAGPAGPLAYIAMPSPPQVMAPVTAVPTPLTTTSVAPV